MLACTLLSAHALLYVETRFPAHPCLATHHRRACATLHVEHGACAFACLHLSASPIALSRSHVPAHNMCTSLDHDWHSLSPATCMAICIIICMTICIIICIITITQHPHMPPPCQWRDVHIIHHMHPPGKTRGGQMPNRS
uniref:Uncharacterized protein n=1 Tax=Haptolina brevifila TaxID=156173 RepID=A0A7S2NIF8_9EUKA